MPSAPVPEPVFAVCVPGRPKGCQTCELTLERHYWGGGHFLAVYGCFVVHCPSGLSSQMGLLSRWDFDVLGAKAFLRYLRHRTQ
eukprot:11881560-Ditylum_brightwellii.AAC.1